MNIPKKSLISLSTAVLVLCNGVTVAKDAAPIKYPETRKGDVVDTYFGVKVPDPYRWLEDDRSAETEDWVKRQNKVTFAYLDKIPYRDQIKDELQAMWNYEKVSAPFKEGDYVYFYKNNGLQNQSVVYRQKDGGEPEVFLDPNTFSKDGTTALAMLKFSKDSKKAAYMISEGGSDWRSIYVIDVDTKKQLEAPLENVKFSGISWRGNEGFYYSSYDKPKGSELSAKTDQHKLYYHKLGEPQSKDQLVFGEGEDQKRRYVGGDVTDDGRFLVVTTANATFGNDVFVKDLNDPKGKLIQMVKDQTSDVSVLDSKGDTLYMVTNRGAPNKRLVKATFPNASPDKWVDVIPEEKNALSVSKGGGYIFAKYIVDALSKVYQYDFEGKKIREIELPGLGTATAISGKKDEEVLYYQFSNYVTPDNIYAYDVKKGESNLYRKSAVDFDADNYESKQVFYKSKDGTKVPMLISYKKGTILDGSAPTILYGYGGFGISLTPRFSTSVAYWLKKGGIYVVPNLRGGGEYGKAWHDQGRQMKKQNVFDDFAAAGEYLIANNYTSSEKLAISGRSNGGLLAGATVLQRPDLFAVSLPGVGVLDMLRYHTFTAGAGWAYDYGTSEQDKAMFEYLKGYSPLHNVKAGTKYPAILVLTNDHDDRVVPAHSFKFAAELQAKQAGSAPTLIRIETDAGHGAGMSVSKQVASLADTYAFTLYNMGVKSLESN